MPYGADTTLLHWLIERAIREKSPFVSFTSATAAERSHYERPEKGRGLRPVGNDPGDMARVPQL